MYLCTPMLGRERMRSRNSLEVLALLPRYDTDAQGGKDIDEDEHTTLRRLLSWRALWKVLAPLIPGTSAWRTDPPSMDEDEDTLVDQPAEFAYIGKQILFGQMRRVYIVPLLYLAGTFSSLPLLRMDG